MEKKQNKKRHIICLSILCVVLMLTLIIMLTKIGTLKNDKTQLSDISKIEIAKETKRSSKDGIYYTAEDALHGYFSAIISGSKKDAMNVVAPKELWQYLSKVYSITEEEAFDQVLYVDDTWNEFVDDLNQYIDKDEEYQTDDFLNVKITAIEAASSDETKTMTDLFDLAGIDSSIQILNYTENSLWDTDYNSGYSYSVNGRWYYFPGSDLQRLDGIYKNITGVDTVIENQAEANSKAAFTHKALNAALYEIEESGFNFEDYPNYSLTYYSSDDCWYSDTTIYLDLTKFNELFKHYIRYDINEISTIKIMCKEDNCFIVALEDNNGFIGSYPVINNDINNSKEKDISEVVLEIYNEIVDTVY